MTDELALTANATFVPTRLGLVVTGNPTVKEWGDFGSQIKAVEGAIQWLIGDWLNYGELHYGEKYKEAIEKTGYDYGTLRDEKWIAGRFEVSRRHDNIPWGHHREVAGVRPDDVADALLDQAAENNWSQKELRKAVRELTHPEELEEPKEPEDLQDHWFKFSFIWTELTNDKMVEVAKDRGWKYYAKIQGSYLWIYVEADK